MISALSVAPLRTKRLPWIWPLASLELYSIRGSLVISCIVTCLFILDQVSHLGDCLIVIGVWFIGDFCIEVASGSLSLTLVLVFLAEL